MPQKDLPEASPAGTVVVQSKKYRSRLRFDRRYLVLTDSSRVQMLFPLDGPPSQAVLIVPPWEYEPATEQTPVITGPFAEKLKMKLSSMQAEGKGRIWQGDVLVNKVDKVTKQRPRVTFGGVTFAGIPQRGTGHMTVPVPVALKILTRGNVYAKLAYHYDDGYGSTQPGGIIDPKALARDISRYGFTAYYDPGKPPESQPHIHVRIHSNESYDVFEKGAAVPAPVDMPALSAASRRKLNAALKAVAAANANLAKPSPENRAKARKAIAAATAVVKASESPLTPPEVLKLAKVLLKNDKLAVMVVDVLGAPQFRKVTRSWGRTDWTSALLNNAKNYEPLLDNSILDAVDHVTISVDRSNGSYRVNAPTGYEQHPDVVEIAKKSFKDVGDAQDEAQKVFKKATVDVSASAKR